MKKQTRPLRSDGKQTYERILEAAGKLFATSGFADTQSKTIAMHAGVDLASINYHFGSRVELYNVVLAKAHSQLIHIETLKKLIKRDISAREKLKKLIEILVDGALVNKSWHAKVLSRELLSPTSSFESLQEHEVQPKLQLIMVILSDITSLSPDDPVLFRCLLNVVAPCTMLLEAHHGPAVFKQDFLMASRDVWVQHFYNFAISGLKAVAHFNE